MTTPKTPIRTVYNESNVAVGLAEFQEGEVVAISSGGTSANTVSEARINLSVDDSNIRGLFSVTGSGGSYNNSTGVFTISGGGGSGDAGPAYDQANTATVIAGLAFDAANAGSGSGVSAAYDQANVATINASAAFDLVNVISGDYVVNADLTTANVTEVTNLYYTDARVYSNVASLGYATNSQLDAYALDTDLTTANVTEVDNLYYTDARVYSNVASLGYATTGYVDTAVANILDSAPEALNTLNELAAALGDDANFATTTATLIGQSYNQANAAYLQANVAIVNLGVAFDSANTKTIAADLTTANVTEVDNLYYTDARSRAALSAGDSTIIYNASTGTIRANVTVLSGGNSNVISVNDQTGVVTLDTDSIDEGSSNFYYTDARVYSNVSSLGYITSSSLNGYATNSQLDGYVLNTDLTTANVSEVDNLYYTDERVYANISPLLANLDVGANLVQSTTDDLAEGSSNLYYTDARVYSNVSTIGYITSASLGGYATNSQLDAYVLDTDLTTANVTEVDNLYYTDARVYANVSPLLFSGDYGDLSNKPTIPTSVSDLTNDLNFVIDADLTTANVVEVNNLYYTDARVYTNVASLGYATTSYVDSAVANLVDSAPATLDTLNELAAALGDDANFATTTATLIGQSYNQANAAYSQANIAIVNSGAAFDSANTKTVAADLTTANVSEVTNLYYTDARVYSNVSTIGYITSSSLNGYATNSQLDAYALDTDLTTANVTEVDNLYYTDARVYANVSSLGYITATSLNGYATNSQLDVYALDTDLTTANVTEVDNLYYTDARVYSNVSSLGYITSSSLNGYATNSQLDAYALDTDLTTANVTEVNNLYYTDARVYSNVSSIGYATTSYVDSAVANIVDSAPEALNTLNELAAALGDDSNFATTTATLIGQSYNQANAAYLQANVAIVNASAAFDSANTKTVAADLTTANVSEVTNLYYTDARAFANLTSASTTSLQEGDNLYFTNTRARAAFTAGTNITITDGQISASVSGGGGGGAGNAFSEVYVSGQSNVVSSGETTLSLVAGTDITITTDPQTNSITINSTASGGGSSEPTIHPFLLAGM